MRIFMTGASGYIGSVVAELAIKQGHEVWGLARSPFAREKLQRLGVVPVDGALQSAAALTKVASQVDGVIHLGLDYQSGSFDEMMRVDESAVRALATGLASTNKGLVTTSGTGVAAPDPDDGITDEDAPLWQDATLMRRAAAEADALSLSAQGVRVSAIRLPPFVYGRGGSSFVPLLLRSAASQGASIHIGDGGRHTSAVDVDEVARLYLLALENASGGSVFNGTSEIDVSLRELAQTIGDTLGVSTKSVSRDDAATIFGPFASKFLEVSSRPSSEKARRLLGWNPQPPYGLLDDIRRGSYRPWIDELKRTALETRFA